MCVSLLGAPCIVIGYNENIAWGSTNGMNDVMDFYDIKFNRDELFKVLDKCINSRNAVFIQNNLEKFIELCKPVIEKYSVNYLNKIGVVKIAPRKHGQEILEDVLENYKVLF